MNCEKSYMYILICYTATLIIATHLGGLSKLITMINRENIQQMYKHADKLNLNTLVYIYTHHALIYVYVIQGHNLHWCDMADEIIIYNTLKQLKWSWIQVCYCLPWAEQAGSGVNIAVFEYNSDDRVLTLTSCSALCTVH